MTTVAQHSSSGDELTPAEVDQLAKEEAIIEAGQAIFMKVGMALARIRDGRLYRATYGTFEAYVDQRWGFTRIRAYQLIEAGVVVASVSTMVDTPEIENERQARALAPIVRESGPEAAADILRDVENRLGKITAKAIEAEAKPKAKTKVKKPPESESIKAKATVIPAPESEPIRVKAHVEPAPESEPIEVKVRVVGSDAVVPTVEAINAMSLREVIDLERTLDQGPSNLRSRAMLDALDAVDDRLHALGVINDSVGALGQLSQEDMAEVAALADWHPTADEITAAINALTRLRDMVAGGMA